MINAIALGSAQIPESEPAEPVVVVVPITGMPDDTYDVTLMLPAELPYADVAITSQDSGSVTLTVTRPDGYAGTPGLTVTVLCTEDVDLDTGWTDISADIHDGWTGLAWVRRVQSIVYLQFFVTATAAIDGTPKTDGVDLLTSGIDPEWFPPQRTDAGILGYAIDDEDQPIVVIPAGVVDGSVAVYGPAGTTGTWTDGVSYVQGQVSWLVAES